MIMKKKGISPLIASVLLIAFTIILFGLITVWIRRAAVEPAMSQTEEKVASELECNEKVVKIVSACKDGNNIKTIVDNNGGSDLYGIKIKAIGSSGASIGDFPSLNIAPLGRSSALSVDVSGKGTITKVEAYPTTSKGICQGQLASTTTIAASC